MKLQACIFLKRKNSSFEKGVAVLKDLNISDVEFIFDQNLKKISNVYDYILCDITFSNILVAIDLDNIHVPRKKSQR